MLAREDRTPGELARGAISITYKAVDTHLRSPVAIHVIKKRAFAASPASSSIGAEKGNALSMFFYALGLEISLGVPQDQNAAKDWFQRSATLGDPRAIERCRELGFEL